MHIAVLAASGATGRELAEQALDRGHTVTAIARTPARLALPDSPRLVRAAADVRQPTSIATAVAGSDVVVSGLGAVKGEQAGILLAGARALIDAEVRRVIWLGAFGTGPSASAAGRLTRSILSLALRAELPDKIAADAATLAGGGTVFHAGPLSNGPLRPAHRTVLLADAPRRLVPQRISRKTVAAAMLDEAEREHRPAVILVPHLVDGHRRVARQRPQPAGGA